MTNAGSSTNTTSGGPLAGGPLVQVRRLAVLSLILLLIIGTLPLLLWNNGDETQSALLHVTTSLVVNEQQQQQQQQQQEHQQEHRQKTQRRRLQNPAFATSTLKQNLQVAKAKYMEQLKADYGPDHVPLLFQTMYPNGTIESIARTIFEATPLSWDRLKRKVALKLLQAQIDEQPQPLIWATGGHSASAGHGNLFNESYTAVMESHVQPMFQAIGLKFVTRRYAMGGTSCGMEINTCIKEVFGTDFDVLSWDYGMTTGRDYGKVELYFHRAALLPSRPAFVGLWLLDRKPMLDSMEPLGPAVFSLNPQSVLDRVPDTAGQTQDEIDQMPPYLRYFRCGKEIERGEPRCGDEKYTLLPNNDPCNQRKGKVSWHPGWKEHALHGNLLTLFWIEIAEDALDEIARRGSDPRVLYNTLQLQEEQEFEPLQPQSGSTNTTVRPVLKFVEKDLDVIADIPNEVIYWNPNYCHTARLPAQIRYQGILTESEEKGDDDGETFDHGSEYKQVLYQANDQMPLAWDANLYQEFCQNYKIVNDHQDFFVVNWMGWSQLVLPNPTEQAAYAQVQQHPVLLGYIQMCLAGCGWGCPKGVLSQKDLLNATTMQQSQVLSMTVNNVPVESFTPVKDCQFLKHAGGHQWTPNADGRFEIRGKTLESPHYLRISAFVIW
ncbi:hypothetical protein ACA910_014747 [Epithemia clementina (nom. ined.)]